MVRGWTTYTFQKEAKRPFSRANLLLVLGRVVVFNETKGRMFSTNSFTLTTQKGVPFFFGEKRLKNNE